MAVLAFVAHRLSFLDRAGAGTALAMGLLILFGLGPGAVALLFAFAAAAFVATRMGVRRKRRLVRGDGVERRGWSNVVGNGATASAVAAAGFLLPAELLVFPFAVAVAVAAADTLASEIGLLSTRVVLITRPRERVPPGVDGGVSLLGTSTSLIAAAVVAALAVVFIGLPVRLVPAVAILGLAGSMLDSVLGALWEKSRERPGRQLSKTQVNLISVSVPTALALAMAWAP